MQPATPLGIAQPDIYDAQLEEKIEKTRREFAQFSPPQLEIFSSPASHFRMRAEFKIWHEGGEAFYAMYKQGEYKQPVKISEFTIGSEKIASIMPPLLKAINASEILRKKLFQAEFLTTLKGECLITLIYHRPLDEEWQKVAEDLSQHLGAKIIGRSKKQKLVLDTDHVTEELLVGQQHYRYQQVEASFTQPNARICESMLSWAQRVSQALSGDLLELYCGNANFTLPLSKNFDRVLATEVSKTSVKSALVNIKENDCDNIEIVRMSSEEFTEALNGVREFRRLKDIDLNSYRFSTIFVDPPRAGLDKDTEKMVSRFGNIIYISCNPETLKNNVEALSNTHEITEFALFDQFPYTDHRECGVLLTKRAQVI